jgi:LmbE family N-acetylglucosaminyl deacetylase
MSSTTCTDDAASTADCWQIPLINEETWVNVLKDVPGWNPPERPLVVVSPHPDDETLGAGGLIAEWKKRNIPVVVIAVTDGEAAYPEWKELGTVRAREQEAALAELGVGTKDIVRLRLPDGQVASHEQELRTLIGTLVTSDSLVIAPWHKDFHPDHEACGRVAEQAASEAGAMLASYLIWTWHRGEVPLVASLPLRRFLLADELCGKRAKALSQHRSQLDRETGMPILPESVLGPARRRFETYVVYE